jgi:hypothetical protein
MTTNAKIGWGATFKMGNPSTLLAIGELTAVSLPNSQTAEVEATHFGSPSRRREYIAGLIDDGEGTFEMNLGPWQHDRCGDPHGAYRWSVATV